MNSGFVFPGGEPRFAVELAQEAERAGWDGFFMWEPVWGVEAWVTLGAIAVRTERIRLGTMITPLARMRPWKLAGETMTVDHLSNGRVILAVGLGAPETGWTAFGEPTERKLRAELLDEGLDIVTGLWRGQPFKYEGKHYTVQPLDFMPPPPPVQQPRIPIWVVGAWSHEKSMRRALKYDGVLPSFIGEDGKARQASPDEVRAIRDYAATQRAGAAPFDIVVEGVTPGDKPAKARNVTGPWAEAGATWWIEAMWSAPDPAAVRRRVLQGPPRL
jgi:alkanesulfonate monooxygenase SsuD/methylene tetrahydromethanopterin reductase-like flavin-dependent oxidoreductase (luciferase family)